MMSNEIVSVQAMDFPSGLNYYVSEYVYDLGYGVVLNAEQCRKLIDWWENEGKDDYKSWN